MIELALNILAFLFLAGFFITALVFVLWLLTYESVRKFLTGLLVVVFVLAMLYEIFVVYG